MAKNHRYAGCFYDRGNEGEGGRRGSDPSRITRQRAGTRSALKAMERRADRRRQARSTED